MFKMLFDEHMHKKGWTDHAARDILVKVIEQFISEGKITNGEAVGKMIDARP